MKKHKVEVYKSRRNGQFSWRVIAKNGKKIACAGETFHNKKDCMKSLSLLKTILAGTHEIIDLTK